MQLGSGGARPRGARAGGAAAARLREVGRGRAQADEQHPPQDGRASVRTRGTTIPHVTQFDKADITALEELRKKYREAGREGRRQPDRDRDAREGARRGAQEVPAVQRVARRRPASEIVYKKYVNVGVAVDTERGLLVPVIRDADQKNIIADRGRAAAARREGARPRKLTLDEMQRRRHQISNLGGIGGTYFTPIVNWPEVAILGISRGVDRAGVRTARQFEPRQMLPLSLPTTTA